ncbi:MAG: type 4a pilus biogenesis protein PilO [Deltaproteobacteria bacterium]|nr:type 4a pilus biogenesis protein PilO [Deltaproteobacteria bacterium]
MEDQKSSFVEKVEKIKMPIRILILVGTLVLLAGAFTWFVYIPKTEAIQKKEKSVKELSRKLAEVEKEVRNREKFEEKFKQVNAQFDEALKILPDSKEIPSLLTNITRLGNEAGLQFLLFTPQNERGRGFYKEIPVSIRVEGTYHNVARFFDSVGRMDRIVNILNVSMKPEKVLSTELVTSCQAVTYQFTAEEPKQDDNKKKKKKRKK